MKTAEVDAGFFIEEGASNVAAELTEASLVDTQARMGTMLEALPIGLMIHTAQAVVYSNRAAGTLLGCDSEALRGRHVLDFLRNADQERVPAMLDAGLAGGGAVEEAEAVLRCFDGSEKFAKITMARLPWPGNPVVQVLIQDVTAQKRAESSLRQQAIVDELTGAYNRRHFFYEGGLYIEDYPRGGRPVSVVMVDVDHFKSINDRFGHAVGDLALRAITEAGHELVPTIAGTNSAMLARVGGEEFAILLPGLECSAAAIAAEQFRRRIARILLDAGGAKLRFTASMGVAGFRPEDRTLERLLVRADGALYRAKQEGRNRVCVAT